MLEALTLGPSERVNVSNAAPTTYVNVLGEPAVVRVGADINTHVRVVPAGGAVEADANYPVVFAARELFLNLAPSENLSFLAYTLQPGSKQTGSIVFAAVADTGDTVTVNDGINSPVVFTFGDGTGGTVNKGVTAQDSAAALEAAIEAASPLAVSVVRNGVNLLLVNDNYVGGSISKSDADNDYVVTNFSGGASPGLLPYNAGSVWVTRVS